jgi:hypothetical protein
MMKLRFLISVMSIALISVACTKTSSISGDGESMIEPGDLIDGFTIIAGESGNFIYPFDLECSYPEGKNISYCKALVGTAVNISTGLYDETRSGKLDEIWANSNYQIYINDHPVDMQAFGTYDYTHPIVGVIRFANVAIIASNPGEISTRDSGVDSGKAFENSGTVSFSEP